MRWCVLGLLVVGCETAPSTLDPGLDLGLRVGGAQLRRGAPPEPAGGPVVSQVVRPQPEVQRGDGTVALHGRLGPGAVALSIQAVGDDAHWIVQPDGFDFVVAEELLWDAQLGFSYALPDSSLAVRLQAFDADGLGGPIHDTTFDVLPDTPPSVLLVSLGWDAAVDLDLSVERPDGVVIGPKNVSGSEPSVVPTAGAIPTEGLYAYDSNQECHLDLRNREDVVWFAPAAPGRYRVYANLFSTCGAASVNFGVAVLENDVVVDETSGTLYDFDAREHPGPGEAPGLLVLEFEVP